VAGHAGVERGFGKARRRRRRRRRGLGEGRRRGFICN